MEKRKKRKPKQKELFAAAPVEAEIVHAEVYTVEAYLTHLNGVLGVEEACVQGEISRMNVHPTGIYITLKDKEADGVLNCYMHAGIYRSVPFPLEDGLEVRATGYAGVFKRRGELSFRVRSIELAGEGSLKRAYELLKRKLEAEGLFTRKRPLPECIASVGLITSRTGAAIDDFRKNLHARGIRVHLYDARVEGAQAIPNVIAGIEWFNRRMPELDVLVICRGGGSLEDLQAFNSEPVARAIFGSAIPTICGIGHDRDICIASLVSDREVSTPTMAATIVNVSWQETELTLERLERALLTLYERALMQPEQEVARAASRLASVLTGLFSTFHLLSNRLVEQFDRVLATATTRVEHAEQYLRAVSPERVLRLGYSVVQTPEGEVVRNASELAAGANVHTILHEGSFDATVTKTEHGTTQKDS